MGASGSSSATVVTVLDQPHATAGGTPVSGKVYLDVRKPVQAGSLQVVISGYERTCVHYTTTSTHGTGKNRKTRTNHHYARARSDFMTVNFALAHFGNEKVPVGQYVYPFNFRIPYGVPPPAEEQGRSNFTIGYSVETCLSRNGGLFSGDIKHSCPLNVISGATRIPISPLYMEPERQNVRTCFCFDRGEILLGGSGNTSIAPRGGNILLSYAVRNLSSVKIQNITIKIIERASWSARQHRAYSSRVLFETQMNASEKNNQTQLDSTDLQPLDKKLQESTMLEIDSLMRELKLRLDAGQASISAVVPNYARCSYYGNGLIRIDHLLILKVNTSTGTANPETTYPIIICNPPLEQVQMPVLEAKLLNEVPALPADWAPVVAQAVVVPLPMCMATPQEQDEENYNCLAVPSAPPAPTSLLQQDGVVSAETMGWESLLAALPGSFEPCKLLDQWLGMNAAQLSSFESHQLTRLFQTLHRTFDQVEAAEILAKRYMTDIKCDAIAAVVHGCFRENHVPVIIHLAGNNTIVDKDNYGVVREQLTAFQWLQVEKYFT